MYRLHVCVDVIVFPFINVIFIEHLAGCLLTTVAPSIRKCPVAPESEKYHSTSRFIFGVLILVVEIGIYFILLAYTIAFPSVCCVFLRSGTGSPNSAILVISGAHLSA